MMKTKMMMMMMMTMFRSPLVKSIHQQLLMGRQSQCNEYTLFDGLTDNTHVRLYISYQYYSVHEWSILVVHIYIINSKI